MAATAASPPTISRSQSRSTANPSSGDPGDTDPQNLKGTTRTLDGALGDKTSEPIGNGPSSRVRAGLLVDDSTRPLFDSADFRFAQRRNQSLAVGRWSGPPAKRRQSRLVLLRLRPRLQASSRRLRARRRPHSAAAALCLRHLVVALLGLQRSGDRRDCPRLPRERYTPLDVFVIDMDWHINREQLEAHGRKGPVRPFSWAGPATPGISCCFPIPPNSSPACTQTV